MNVLLNGKYNCKQFLHKNSVYFMIPNEWFSNLDKNKENRNKKIRGNPFATITVKIFLTVGVRNHSIFK